MLVYQSKPVSNPTIYSHTKLIHISFTIIDTKRKLKGSIVAISERKQDSLQLTPQKNINAKETQNTHSQYVQNEDPEKQASDTGNSNKDSSVCVEIDSSIMSDSGKSWFKLIIVVYLYISCCFSMTTMTTFSYSYSMTTFSNFSYSYS